MQTSKPFAFIVWGSVDRPNERLVRYLLETFRSGHGQDFDFFFAMNHRPEAVRSYLSSFVPEGKKWHTHCVVHISKPWDYQSQVERLVELHASAYPEFGEMPVTVWGVDSGKQNHMEECILYFLHDPRYMAYCKRKRNGLYDAEKEPHSPDEFIRSDDAKLNSFIERAYAWVEGCSRVEDETKALVGRVFDSVDDYRLLMECANSPAAVAAIRGLIALRDKPSKWKMEGML